jgi:hypothetical protein
MQRIRLTERVSKESDRKKFILRYFALNGNRPESFSHRIDTRPEGTLPCVLAWEKRPKFFTRFTRFVPMFVPMKNFCVHCTPGWRHMMAYFNISTHGVTLLVHSLFCALVVL